MPDFCATAWTFRRAALRRIVPTQQFAKASHTQFDNAA